ncbi:MAG TPA: class I SAM-dependent methyltransferase [Pirellulaceae bacterium]|nr:class I SAM-dependent methyltransferase [Pirellulaceae bacterium]
MSGHPVRIKIDISGLTEAQATLLMPLWSRALESRRSQPLIRDEKAEEIISRLDFDFDTFRRKSVPAVDYCLRASVIDQLVKRFLGAHEQATIVELGVGLDTRSDRLDNGRAIWIELDLPDAMRVRQKFFQPNSRRTMISSSLLDSDWFEQTERYRRGPILFIAEGVFYFFEEKQVCSILSRLADRFPASSLIFDAQSPWFLRISNLRHPLRDSRLKFSLASVRDIESWDRRLRVQQCIGFGDSPYYDAGMPRLSRLRRWGRRLFPPVRHLFKVVHVGW